MEPAGWGKNRYGAAIMPDIQSKNARINKDYSISKQRSQQEHLFRKINQNNQYKKT